MHRTDVKEAVNAAGIGIWEWNLKTEQNYVSETWARMLGYSKQELSTISFLQMIELVHPEERPLLQQEVNQSLGPDQVPLDFTMRMRHKQGIGSGFRPKVAWWPPKTASPAAWLASI